MNLSIGDGCGAPCPAREKATCGTFLYVKTHFTPLRASAFEVSIFLILAKACGERNIFKTNEPGTS